MPFLTRFVVLVALSCAALEGAHACLYLNPPDNLVDLSELAPLIRRASPTPSTPLDSPKPHVDPDFMRDCINACQSLRDPENTFCLDLCLENPTNYGLSKYQHLALPAPISHREDHGHSPAPVAEHGESPNPLALAVAPLPEELGRAGCEAWCRKRAGFSSSVNIDTCKSECFEDPGIMKLVEVTRRATPNKDLYTDIKQPEEFVCYCVVKCPRYSPTSISCMQRCIASIELKAVWEKYEGRGVTTKLELTVEFSNKRLDYCRNQADRSALVCMQEYVNAVRDKLGEEEALVNYKKPPPGGFRKPRRGPGSKEASPAKKLKPIPSDGN